MASNEQLASVGGYFNQIAAHYPAKYHPSRPFHYYFFTERLEEATRGIDYRGKATLDIGAGTCAVYSYLKAQLGGDFPYYAYDIAPEMLAQSEVPTERRFSGELRAQAFPLTQFDRILMLGVTTYMPAPLLADTLGFVEEHLTPGGLAMITFTHRHGLDTRLRRLAKSLLAWLPGSRRGVVQQRFSVHTYSLPEVGRLLKALPGMRLREVRWLNHTVFPFSQLLPKASVALAKRHHRRPKPWLSSDFLVVLEKAPAA